MTTIPTPQNQAGHSLRQALEGVLSEYDHNTCQHEDTHRGGTIWTICDGCGRKWADDEGGFRPYVDPPAVAFARKILCDEPVLATALSSSAAAGSAEEAKPADELTEDEIRHRASVMILNQGWRPGQKLSGQAVRELMTKLGMALLKEPPTDRCAHPDCGCDADAVCSAAPTPTGASRSETGRGEDYAPGQRAYGAYRLSVEEREGGSDRQPILPMWATLKPSLKMHWAAVEAALTTRPVGDDALREALAWYGEQARLARLITKVGDIGRHALDADGGKRAAVALANTTQPAAGRGAGDEWANADTTAIRHLRMRLEGALSARREEGDAESVSWLAAGVKALDEALVYARERDIERRGRLIAEGRYEPWRQECKRLEKELRTALAPSTSKAAPLSDKGGAVRHIQALGAAISRREWSEVEAAHAALRDARP